MSKIKVLPPSVADRIAAGEVIERPTSVVKELVENSIDAKASNIAVILEDGGKQLIQVVDDGEGIQPDDLKLCAKRHATSKLEELEDLEKIKTLGFRGEALPSISAVADTLIISRNNQNKKAYEARLASDQFSEIAPITFGHFLSEPHGTVVKVANLFSQIPVRLKFLKSQGAEVSYVRDWIERLSLSHPEVGFRLVHNEKTILNLPGQKLEERTRAILADGDDYPVSSATTQRDPQTGLKITLHWINGLSLSHTRKLVQVVNNRVVKDRVIQQAILNPFKQSFLPGRFPALLAIIEIDPSQLDVNVHPAKTEIRFLNQSKLFPTFQSLIDQLIQNSGNPAYIPGNPPTPAQRQHWSRPLWKASQDRLTLNPYSNQNELTSPLSQTNDHKNDKNEDSTESTFINPFSGATYVGNIFSTYILYDAGEELILLDQHAAHERVRYEKLKTNIFKEDSPPEQQQLLLPEAIQFNSEEHLKLTHRLHWLSSLGFETEIFGESTLLFRSVPTSWGTDALQLRLKGLVDRVLEQDEMDSKENLEFDENLFESLASEACHSAIRAGDRLSKMEAESLVTDLFKCDHPWNCPHGRPSVVKVPRSRFEEWFQRKV